MEDELGPIVQQHLQSVGDLYFSIYRKYVSGVQSDREALADSKIFLQGYVKKLQQRPQNTGIEYWKEFVAEFFAEDAKVGICMSSYNKKDIITPELWKRSCGICKENPGFGFEISREFLAGLCMLLHGNDKINKELQIDDTVDTFATRPAPGNHTFLKSVIVRRQTVARDRFKSRAGRLNIIFNPAMKICAAEFCACDDHNPALEEPCAHQIAAFTKLLVDEAEMHLELPPAQEKTAPCCHTNPYAHLNIAKKKELARALQGTDVLNLMLDLMRFTTMHGVPPPGTMAKHSSDFQELDYNVMHILEEQPYSIASMGTSVGV